MNIIFDIGVIVFLIFINGFFSGSEIAIISLKKSRLQTLAAQGLKSARLLIKIKEDPDHFFATVQIGVTLVGTIASAYGGTRLLVHLHPFLYEFELPIIGPYITELAFMVFVISIAYFTLIFGELVPKSLALHYSERTALVVAYPLAFFSKLFYSFTFLLTVSSNLVLKPFRDKTSFSESRFQEEEIKHLLQEGLDAGTIDETEHTLIENVFEINDTQAKEIMEPRPQINAIDSESSRMEILKLILDLPFSRVPVFKESLDNIIGVLHTKDYMREVAMGNTPRLENLIRPAYFIPESMKIDKVMKELQARKIHVAIVVDEYGVTAGILTMENILEEIVGKIADIEDLDADIAITKSQGIYKVPGICSVDDFNHYFRTEFEGNSTEIPDSESYNSVAGYVIVKLGRFPEVGEEIRLGGYEFKLSRRVKNQLVQFNVTSDNDQKGKISRSSE